MDSLIPLKLCCKCNLEFPANTEYFYPERKNKDGLRTYCIKCERAYRKQLYDANAERHREYARNQRVRNPERVHERQRAFRKRHHDKILERNRQYRAKNPEKVRAAENRWRQSPKGKASGHLRYARERNAANFTPREWETAVNYFHGCCAVCGRQAKDLFNTHTLAADHWIPLSKGGVTTGDNIVPLCHGINGCNNSKHNSDPVIWLEKKLGKRKAKKKLKEITAYFESIGAKNGRN